MNLLVHFAEKILLLNPTNARGDYPDLNIPAFACAVPRLLPSTEAAEFILAFDYAKAFALAEQFGEECGCFDRHHVFSKDDLDR